MYLRSFLVAAFLSGVVVFHYAELLGCVSACTIDIETLYHVGPSPLAISDVRLNTWILSTIQHNLLHNPGALFEGNALFPAQWVLAGSEHLLGLGLLTLPLHAVTDHATTIYNLTLVASSLILALSSYALVAWLTGKRWVALLIGACVPFMPWRIAELSHLQLAGAHWFPAIWLLWLRVLVGEGRRSDSWWLFGLLTLQLLTSFYLAYFLTFTMAVLAVTTWWLAPRRLANWRRAVVPVAASLAVLVLTSVPYLSRQASGELHEWEPPAVGSLWDAFLQAAAMLAPREGLVVLAPFTERASYALPLGVLAAACLALVWLACGVLGKERSGEGTGAEDRTAKGQGALKERVAIVGFVGCCLAALFLMLGPEATVFGFRVPLPWTWAANLVPGFGNMRAPFRFGIVICLALPVLAGLGLHGMEMALSLRSRSWRLRASVLSVILVAFAVTVPWGILPVRAADTETPERVAIDAALASLPVGPVLEFPWFSSSFAYVITDTRAMVGATKHHKPLLNGFTAYLPPSFRVLRRLAQDLPSVEAIDQLTELTGLRWIVLHGKGVYPATLKRWKAAVDEGSLRVERRLGRSVIYEVPQREHAGAGVARLRMQGDSTTTLGGLARTELPMDSVGGTLAIRMPAKIGPAAVIKTLAVTVTNKGEHAWPGLDPHWEGLVMLRYSFDRPGQGFELGGLVALDRDVADGETVTLRPHVPLPPQSGVYRLCVDLVQVVGDRAVPLPIGGATGALEVKAVERPGEPTSRAGEPPVAVTVPVCS